MCTQPRWGRNVESPGEDPLVAGTYGTAYTQGLQQYTGKEKVVQSVVTLKHYFACGTSSRFPDLSVAFLGGLTRLIIAGFGRYSIESYTQPGSSDPAQQQVQRYSVDVNVSAYDLAHTYFPAWEQTVGSCPQCGRALGVMCSCEYNMGFL